jgi:hypothetical protein
MHCEDTDGRDVDTGDQLSCKAGEGHCPAKVDCVGKWSTCSAFCKKTYIVSTPNSGGGLHCEDSDGRDVVDGTRLGCKAGEGHCPAKAAKVDCKGNWSTCSAFCKKTYIVSTPNSDGGMHCEDSDGRDVVDGTRLSCKAGEGHCPAKVDCKGNWSTCNADCKKTYTVTTPSSGGGMHCEDTDGRDVDTGDQLSCKAGEGHCPAKVDCVGKWSTCSAFCKKTYIVSTPNSGGGLHCEDSDGRDVHNGTQLSCDAGQGNCPATVNTTVTPSE